MSSDSQGKFVKLLWQFDPSHHYCALLLAADNLSMEHVKEQRRENAVKLPNTLTFFPSASSNVVTVYKDPAFFKNCVKLPSVMASLPSCGGAFLAPLLKDEESDFGPGGPSTAKVGRTVHKEILLGTTLVLAENSSKVFQPHRALLHSGSQVSLICEACATDLGLKTTAVNLHVGGVSVMNMEALKCAVTLKLRSPLEPNFEGNIQAYIVPQVTTKLPSVSFEKYAWPYLASLPLADPGYNRSQTVDILLGADCLNVIMRDEKPRRGRAGEPMAQSTVFGWVLSGPVSLKIDLAV